MRFCALASGSSGNAIYVGHADSHLLVDAGISGKKIAEGLQGLGVSPDKLQGLLITHEHTDHIQGAAIISRRYGIPIYGTEKTLRAVADGARGGLNPSLIRCIVPDEPFRLGDFEIMPYRISHDAADPVGYTLTAGGHKLGMATDLGVFDDYTVSKLSGSDALYIEANHDYNMLMAGSYPYVLKNRIHSKDGHLSNDDTALLIKEIQSEKLKNIVLAHISKENNFEELAYETVRSGIESFWNYENKPCLYVARRYVPSQPIEL